MAPSLLAGTPVSKITFTRRTHSSAPDSQPAQRGFGGTQRNASDQLAQAAESAGHSAQAAELAHQVTAVQTEL